MERLTFEGNFCDIAMCQESPCPYNGSCSQREIWERLKAYEETGLTPEEVEIMRETKADAQFMLTELCCLCDYDRLEELAHAEQESRLVVLPERPRVVAGRHECGRFYSELTGEEVASILNAYANGKLVPVGALAAGVATVVRCKDCKHSAEESYSGEFLCSRKMLGLVRSTDFCSYGERKDGDG